MARSTAGRVAAKAGRAFEERIEEALDLLLQQHIVEHWHHTQPGYRMIGRGRFMPVAAGVADFSAVLRGGLALAIEAKAENSRRFARARVSELQQAHLAAVHRAGGIALLAVQLRDDEAGRRDVFIAPWATAPWEVARSAETLTAAGLAPYRVEGEAIDLSEFYERCAECGRCWRPLGSVRCDCERG